MGRSFRGPTLAITALLLPSATTAKLVLDGGDAGWSSAWGTSVDGVMGGKSSIAVSFDDGMRATGYLNTDGGGFAGCSRNVAEPVDVSSYAGVAVTYAALDASAPPLALELRLGGEGDTGGSWIDHRAVFALSPSADADGVGVATLPFDAFVPRWRGSERTGSLDLTAINQMGLQLLFQEGAYDFTILEIAVVDDLVRDDPAPALGAAPSPAEVVEGIDATIEVGVYVYNKGYPSQCDKIYAATARSVAASLEGGAGLREDARAALADAAAAAEAMGYSENDEIHRAWALRHGLDDARAAAVAAGDDWEAEATHANDATDATVATDGTDATDATHATDVADVSDAADTADAADAADAADSTTDSTDSAAPEPEPATDSSSSSSSDDNDMVMLLALAGAVAVVVAAVVTLCLRRVAPAPPPLAKVQDLAPQKAAVVATAVPCGFDV
ncbi:expressed protein [Aureococcus anophagefferens]|uniref:Expressed protein n=1 Tax=Aureococcus anophagefferens TaxID=44056 RepID=F0YGK7_AURAN|nr:expressed protein [Aureococcus anophagefferens]EGB05778.1 expressed protein [Aureococcus anophagefferens]|eukprot:XP_009039616.1 expressed protein [Aureococcus anophagefferens]